MQLSMTKKMILSAFFLALGIVLPFLTGQIPTLGAMLLPMHIPVLLCGLLCGPRWGAVVGAVTPLLRSLLFFMPPLYPAAVAMAFELLTYGAVIGVLFLRVRRRGVASLLGCLLAAMVAGRLAWGGAQMVLLGVGADGFTAAAFLTGAVTGAIPGIVLQLVLIPTVMVALERMHMVSLHSN
ncbi:MAG: ECF transporter S component [Clostridia bacterium]|nr:ECF transporter S component [Clostridia bacterium]